MPPLQNVGVVTTFYTLVGILSILFWGVALDIITCRPLAVDEEIEFCAVQTASTSSVTRDFASQNVSLRERDCHLPHGGRLRETNFNTPINTNLSFKF